MAGSSIGPAVGLAAGCRAHGGGANGASAHPVAAEHGDADLPARWRARSLRWFIPTGWTMRAAGLSRATQPADSSPRSDAVAAATDPRRRSHSGCPHHLSGCRSCSRLAARAARAHLAGTERSPAASTTEEALVRVATMTCSAMLAHGRRLPMAADASAATSGRAWASPIHRRRAVPPPGPPRPRRSRGHGTEGIRHAVAHAPCSSGPLPRLRRRGDGGTPDSARWKAAPVGRSTSPPGVAPGLRAADRTRSRGSTSGCWDRDRRTEPHRCVAGGERTSDACAANGSHAPPMMCRCQSRPDRADGRLTPRLPWPPGGAGRPCLAPRHRGVLSSCVRNGLQTEHGEASPGSCPPAPTIDLERTPRRTTPCAESGESGEISGSPSPVSRETPGSATSTSQPRPGGHQAERPRPVGWSESRTWSSMCSALDGALG